MSRALKLLVVKDVTCLWRAKAQLAAVLGFAMLLVVVASFAFRQIGYGEEELRALTPGIIWIIFLFSGVLGLNYTFLSEQQNAAVQGVLMTPVDPSLVYLSKCFSNVLFLLGVQILVICLHSLLFSVPLLDAALPLALIVLLTATGFSALGTLFSAMAVCCRAREVLLPLMLFPLCLPLIAGAVFLSREALGGGGIDAGSFWFVLLCGFDVISLTLSWLLFEYVLR